MIFKNHYGIYVLLFVISFGTKSVLTQDESGSGSSSAPSNSGPMAPPPAPSNPGPMAPPPASSDPGLQGGSSKDNPPTGGPIIDNMTMTEDLFNMLKGKDVANTDECKNAIKLKIENEKLKETVTELSLQMTKVTGDLKLQILSHIEEADAKKSEIATLMKKLKDLEGLHNSKSSQCGDMKAQIGDYKKQYNALNNVLNSKNDTINRLTEELVGKKAELTELKKEVDCKRMENCALAQVGSETKTQLNKCSQELALIKQELNKCKDCYCVLEDKFIHTVTPEVKICLNESTVRSKANSHEAIRAEHAYSQTSKCQCSCPSVPKCNNEDSVLLKKVVELVGKKFKCKCEHKERDPEPETEVTPPKTSEKKPPCFTFRPSIPETRPEAKPKCTEQSIVVVTGEEGPKSAYYVDNPTDLPQGCVPIHVHKPPTPPKKKTFVKRIPPCIYVPGVPEAEKYKDNEITISGFDCVNFQSLTIHWKKIHYDVRLFGDNKNTTIENYKVWVNGNDSKTIEIESGRLQSILLHADSKSLLPTYIMVDETQPSNVEPNTGIALVDPSSNVVYTTDRVYIMRKPIFNYILPNQVSLIISSDTSDEMILRSVIVDPLSIKYFLEELVKQPDYAICFNRAWWSSVSNPNLSSRTFRKISIIKSIENPDPVIHGGPFLGADGDSGNKLTKLVIDQPAMRLTASYADDPSVTIDCRLTDKSDIEIFKVLKDAIGTIPISIIGE